MSEQDSQNDFAWVPTESDSILRGSLRQQVTARILTAVFQGRFRSGQRLVVQRLAEIYQVSPTPVRESLVELSGIGIVELLPNRGAVLRPFGRKEVHEISQIRRVLEVEAVRGACGRIDAESLTALGADLTRLEGLPRNGQWDSDAREADTRLHKLIAANCGSLRLEAEIERYLTLFRTLRDVSHRRDSWTNFSRSNDVPEHLAIVRALISEDPEAAAAALDRHIRSSAEILEEIVFPASGGESRAEADIEAS